MLKNNLLSYTNLSVKNNLFLQFFVVVKKQPHLKEKFNGGNHF